jgi:hypothetical protein
MEENSTKENLRIEKLKAEESKIEAKDQARTQAYKAKELQNEKSHQAKEDQRIKFLAEEAIKEEAKDKARREAYLEREKQIAKDQDARIAKNKK